MLHSLVLIGLIFAAYVLLVAAPTKGTLAVDTVAYWGVDLASPYHGVVGQLGFFAYAPPIALLLAPFGALPWLAFVVGWYCLLVAALLWLGGRSVLMLLAFPPVAINLSDGNIHLFLAVAIVLGFRYPAAWSAVLLTKVTPGIGLLWFAARREWRALAMALGATAAIAAVTFVFLPTQWFGWIAMLLDNAGVAPPPPALPVPLWLRLPVAAVIVWWGARRGLRWTVPIAAALSEPALWPASFAIMAACWPLRRPVPAGPSAEHGYHAADAGAPRNQAQRAAA